MDRRLADRLLTLGLKLKKAREYEDAAAQIYALVSEEFKSMLTEQFAVDFGSGVLPVVGRDIIASIADGDGSGPDCILCISEDGRPVRVRFPR